MGGQGAGNASAHVSAWAPAERTVAMPHAAPLAGKGGTSGRHNFSRCALVSAVEGTLYGVSMSVRVFSAPSSAID